MTEAVAYCYLRGKQMTNRMRKFLIAKGFTEETLNLLNFENLSLLAEEYQFKK
jgi:hypothetical protein